MSSAAADLIGNIFVPEKERIALEDIPESLYYKTFCRGRQNLSTNSVNRQLIEMISIRHMKPEEEILSSVVNFKLD